MTSTVATFKNIRCIMAAQEFEKKTFPVKVVTEGRVVAQVF